MKKYLFGMFAIVFAVALSAFTTPKSVLLLDKLFEFTGDPSLTSDIENPLKYQSFTGNPETFCGDPDVDLCVIVVPDTEVYPSNHATWPSKPKVNVNPVKAEIAAAIAAGADDVTGSIKVYLKP
jgi:hypothetical protein